jgi:beta-glucosidase/6-phospho-beta-glucosidase/beta-galactosidase
MSKLLTGLLASGSTLVDPELCLGLGECPDFPSPYEDGVYPTSYNYTGTFPDGFIWGLGTASYQVEGAYNEDGRGASIWDTFTGANTVGMVGSQCDEMPCPINDVMVDVGATGNVACNTYHNYVNDVAMMRDMGLKHYRFSISWPRVVPSGQIKDGINELALVYYDNLINELVNNGITPYVTLYHWDLPQALLDDKNDMYGWYSTDDDGHPNGQMTQHFVDYANILFDRYGDRVKTWMTFNEAWTFTYLGSGNGKAPSIEEYNDISIYPFIAGHNVLLAHAAVVALYRNTYQESQQGKIGITNNCDYREPYSHDPQDIGAAERYQQFWLGWFADPIFLSGDYPSSMKTILGDRLPTFTQEESDLVKGSADFFGLNHYGTGFAQNSDSPEWMETYATVNETSFEQAQSAWLFASGWGVRKLLNWINNRYNNNDDNDVNYDIYITEGGWSIGADSAAEAQHDIERGYYYANYTSEILKAINEDHINVKGYFAWSLMDNFEWEMGYTERFGIIYNDFNFGTDSNTSYNSDNQPQANGQVRTLKDSACWFQDTLWSSNSLADPSTIKCNWSSS